LTCSRLKCSEAEARDYIRRVDEERIRWARFMYGANIRDPGLYDICVNMERFPISGVCDLLMDVVRHKEFAPTDESLRQVENSFVSTEVLAALVGCSETFHLEMGAAFEEGKLRLEGPYLDPPELERVFKIARSVPGVGEVSYEPGYAPAFRMLHEK